MVSYSPSDFSIGFSFIEPRSTSRGARGRRRASRRRAEEVTDETTEEPRRDPNEEN